MERHIVFERCFNFRDLGGYEAADGRRVRWRRLFRGMTPEFMTQADLRLARDELAIRSVIDFRWRGESSGPLARPPVRRANIDFDWDGVPDGLQPEDFFRRFTRLNGRTIVFALRQIVASDAPVFMHCSVGRDRTGIVAAAVLKLLGVSDDDVVEDYMHSVPGFEAAQALRSRMGYDPGFNLLRGRPRWSLGAPQESWVRAILAALDAGEGVGAFVRAAGASPELIQRLQEWALE